MRALSAFLTSGFLLSVSAAFAQSPLAYTVTIDPKNSNQFQVKLEVPANEKLKPVYQFAATAPGTYQVMDIGRFVSHFQALDKNGKKLKVKQLNTNQWQLLQPENTRQITYTIAETWDTPVTEHEVYRMCGTSLEKDHALLNGQAIFGFPEGMQNRALSIKLNYPKEWQAGTALEKDANGNYLATSYDHAVDSPILLGRLTKASTQLGNTQIELYCYSKTDLIRADSIMHHMHDMLNAAQRFLVELPVNRYTFLYHFEDEDRGAWEHSYSSEYVMAERPLNEDFADGIVSIAAHEFFHIVTPLNLHSEVIEQFNFVKPTGSEYLWLYEGVTEWASDMMRLRGGLMTLDEYLTEVQHKVEYDHYDADSTYSLSKLGLNSFSNEGQKQYNNIYQRGAVVAGLLDLRLVQLSGGKRGLREVLLELTKEYGPDKPFSEANFFREFEKRTYPEIGDFFARYVKRAEPLPLKEYYATIGIQYWPNYPTGGKLPSIGTRFELHPDRVIIQKPNTQMQACGLTDGDLLLAFEQEKITRKNVIEVLEKIKNLPVGTEYALTVSHKGKTKTVRCKLQQKDEVKEFYFAPNPRATPEQLAQREKWMKNL